MKKLLQAVSANHELVEKIGAMTKAELNVLARELGFELTDADFEMPATELTDEELDAVTSGARCICSFGGGGKAGEGKRLAPVSSVAVASIRMAAFAVSASLAATTAGKSDS